MNARISVQRVRELISEEASKFMESAFNKGEKVVSTTTTQGLREGQRYTVSGFSTRETPLGDFIMYEVEDDSGEKLLVNNGHILLQKLKEDVDHEGISNVVSAASKLLGAVKKFKEGATGQMTHAVTPHMEQLQRVLEDMIQTPGSYVKVVTPQKKVVTLRAVQSATERKD